ncbi:hypothetical protein [Flavobacterium saccharophilum]|uniref:Lipoprotein n=1 Tax=Flavobacterium saccharophilum TaxID=29534 RepID=A0A1M6Z7P1_9FLAO|nr:hypothetical protein [Flavobacterium saccharophilum]SHL26430.1 hypothetical protein SAMN05444366_0150 [Flavobacterium saccharophilum]
MIKKSFLIFFIFLITACSKNDKPIVAFYYWKTVFRLSTTEREVLKENNVKKLYIRYFDIRLHPKTTEPIPVSPIHFQENIGTFDIVPVVFIQNKVLLKANIDIDDLAKKTLHLVNQISISNKINCFEIQIDCDWTLASKDNYLKFIERFRKLSNKKLSATIRLHQVKYFKKTKIPNVDSGVLMYYNMGTIAPDSVNSIYDHEIAGRYLKSLKKYPLHLDIALPIYSWAIHIRNQKVIGLRSKLNVAELKKDKNFEQFENLFFKVKKSNYKNGFFYEEGDVLKIEAISAEDLKTMGEELNENVANTPKEIIFYDLDEFNLKNYEKNIFEQVVSCF